MHHRCYPVFNPNNHALLHIGLYVMCERNNGYRGIPISHLLRSSTFTAKPPIYLLF